MSQPTNPINRQSGAVLVISLIMLLLLTMIGVSSSQNAGMEERMAGNSRDKNLAFQAAESALRAAESSLPRPSTDFTAAGTNGLYSTPPTNTSLSSQILTDGFWGAGTTAISYTGFSTSTSPRYIIQDLGCFSLTPPCPAGSQHNYRITAYATGGTTAAVAILQSIFRI
jgi:type IV pilus assembly protein PilX